MEAPHSPSRVGLAGRGKWTIDMRAVALVLVVFALATLAVALLRRSPRETERVATGGTVLDTRVVADHATETKWGSELIWRAEYKVAYSVDGHQYVVWSDSGIRGESEAGVRLVLPQSRPLCEVRYDPDKPGVSIAACQ